jgi:hypothetical protein
MAEGSAAGEEASTLSGKGSEASATEVTVTVERMEIEKFHISFIIDDHPASGNVLGNGGWG